VAQRAVALLEQRGKQIADLQVAVKRSEKEVGDLKKTEAATRSASEAAKVDILRRENEAKQLRKSVEDLSARNIELVGDFNKLRDRTVTAELSLATTKEYSEQLLAEVNRQKIELVQLKANFATAGTGGKVMPGTPTTPPTRPDLVKAKLNPPPENIEGRITRIDGNYIGISVGSDQGLARGNTMLVFRLSDSGKYIGQVRIVEVNPGSAVGQWIDRPRYSPKVGDRVGSRILGN